MAVRGLTVGIGADASEFNKEIKKMGKELRRSDQEARQLKKQLNFKWDSGKFVQAQKAAKDALEQSNVKAKSLRKRLKQLDSVGTDKTSEAYRKLQVDLARTEGNAVSLKRKLKEMNDLKFTRLSSRLTKLGSKLSSVGRTMTTHVTAPLIAAAGAAVKFGLDLDTALRKVSTLFGDVSVDTEDLRNKIQALAGATGIAATELSEGLYQALSAGVDVTEDMATSMTFLETATSLAKAGFTDTASAVDAMTTVLNAYGMEASDAAKVSDILLATQNKGKTTVDQLAQSISKVIPTAAALGTSFEDVSASLAGLTAQGIPTQQATTSLNMLLTELGKTGTTASDILKNKTGKSFKDLMEQGLGLGEVLGILTEGAKGSDTAMIDLFGSVEAAKGFMALSANEGKAFAESLDAIKNSSGTTATALEKVDGPAYDLKESLQQIKTALQDVGATLIPLVVTIAKKIAKITDSFNGLDEGTKKTILGFLAFAAVLGPVILVVGGLVSAIGAVIGVIPVLLAGLTLLAAHPIVAVILGVILLITALVLWMKHLYKTNEKFRMGLDRLAKFLMTAFRAAVNSIPYAVEKVIDGIEWMINGAIGLINKLIVEINKIGKYLGFQLDMMKDIEMSVDLPEWDLPTQKIGTEMEARVTPVVDDAGMEALLSGNNNLENVATTNIDNSNKDIVIEVTVENYAEEVDVDEMIKQINLKLAEAM